MPDDRQPWESELERRFAAVLELVCDGLERRPDDCFVALQPEVDFRDDDEREVSLMVARTPGPPRLLSLVAGRDRFGCEWWVEEWIADGSSRVIRSAPDVDADIAAAVLATIDDVCGRER